MKKLIDRFFTLALVVCVALLAGTAWTGYFGHHLEGQTLRLHMMISGILVVGLPIFGLWWILRIINRDRSGGLQRFGFWTTILFGLLTILTVFACMLPLASTEQMEALIQWHGYAGLAMVPAVVLFGWGASAWHRSESTRSDTPG